MNVRSKGTAPTYLTVLFLAGLAAAMVFPACGGSSSSPTASTNIVFQGEYHWEVSVTQSFSRAPYEVEAPVTVTQSGTDIELYSPEDQTAFAGTLNGSNLELIGATSGSWGSVTIEIKGTVTEDGSKSSGTIVFHWTYSDGRTGDESGTYALTKA